MQSPLEEAFEVRAITASDVAEIVTLHLASFPVHSTPRFLARVYYPTFLAPGATGFGYAAVRDGRLIGYCVAAADDAALHRAMLRRHPFECLWAALGKFARRRRLVHRPVTRPVPRIHYLATRPEARGRGLGTRFVRLALDDLRNAGHAACWVAISRHNAVSIALHQRLGFELDSAWTRPGVEFQEYRCDLAVPTRNDAAPRTGGPGPV